MHVKLLSSYSLSVWHDPVLGEPLLARKSDSLVSVLGGLGGLTWDLPGGGGRGGWERVSVQVP